MSRHWFGVSLRYAILISTCFALLASCASEGNGGFNDSSGAIAHGGPGGGPRGGLGGGVGSDQGGGPGGGRGPAPVGDRSDVARASYPGMPSPSQSIAVDQSGNIYVADAASNRILRIDASGQETITAGTGRKGYSGDGGSAVSAELSSPCGVAVDHSGTVYIADTSNNRVRKVDSAGIISTVAGNGKKGDLGDGGPATSAEFSAPTGLAIDRDGNLIIFDSGNSRLRVVAADGTITTVAALRIELSNGVPQGAQLLHIPTSP